MMGTGKTTVGKIIAKKLGYRFADTDALIEQATQQTIPQIFDQDGESAFRQLETQVLSQVAPYTRLVVATGGGIVTQPKNWSYLHHGIVIWLDVPLALLQTRLQGDTQRPLLQRSDWIDQLQTLNQQRQKLYAQADVRVAISAQQSPTTVADAALIAVHQLILENPVPTTPPEIIIHGIEPPNTANEN
ncbi:MAG: shikimate kinase [Leptolyngbyaceae cyanobacterium SM1_1_3]|nr:shikimate kinase [Leptolyngbyaceae cyanobacterium SM1_1_3]NJN02520.1 shikimate kinase [Leptolyngbyaceae cyanobacterium RM1_1_2]NJO11076.1 shikimate kinase [Leptolyngbyaceae cyanobacterium SL_1_1]